MGRWDRVQYRGVTVNRRTRNMLIWAEKRAGIRFNVSQGSYSSSVGASAGTHSGAGAVDIGLAGLSMAQKKRVVYACKDAGFAAWYRPETPGVWGAHCHALAIGDPGLAPLAKQQVVAYDRRRDGLARNGPDRSYRPPSKRQWAYLRGRPVNR